MLPLDSFVRKAVTIEPRRWSDVAAAGDDYEVLAAVAPGRARDFVTAAQADGVNVSRIGSFAVGDGVDVSGLDGSPIAFDRTGWDHF